MENASKALIMAAGVLISLVILGAFMLMMSNLTDYQDKSYQAQADAQTVDFNNQYASYARDNIRGNDMISLMNKVLDYNDRKTDEGYTEMQISFTISNDIRQKLTFDGTNRLITKPEYNQDNIDEIVGPPDSTGIIREIEDRYEQKYASQLSMEISTIQQLYDENDVDGFNDLQLLPKELSTYSGGLTQVYEDALTYNEYEQFKRTTFDCTGTDYDENTGRIINMEFECTGIGV